MFAVCAIGAVVLAKEKLLMIFAALGFVAIQSAIYLALHPWRWGVFVVGVLTGIPALLANRYWRKPKLGYQWPSEMGAVDALLSLASIFGFIFLFFVVARILFGRVR